MLEKIIDTFVSSTVSRIPNSVSSSGCFGIDRKFALILSDFALEANDSLLERALPEFRITKFVDFLIVIYCRRMLAAVEHFHLARG